MIKLKELIDLIAEKFGFVRLSERRELKAMLAECVETLAFIVERRNNAAATNSLISPDGGDGRYKKAREVLTRANNLLNKK